MNNRFGTLYTLTSFGESHGKALGGVIDGMPAGVAIDESALQRFVARRRPGQSAVSTARNEADEVELLSGIYQGKTLGTPIGFIVRNTDHHSGDYDEMARCYRPSHADYTYEAKYGLRDPRGGGRASARETVTRMVAGGLAMQLLNSLGVKIVAYTSQVGTVTLDEEYHALDLSLVDSNIVRCPDEHAAQQMIEAIATARQQGDTLGGVVTCVAQGVPVGLGEPVAGKLHAMLGAAMLSINAAKSFDMGCGRKFAAMRGSQANDTFVWRDGAVHTTTNHSGGIQGGISNGEDIWFEVAFKPVATLMRDITTIDRDGNTMTLKAKGRHDPCVVPRAVPIVEAMTAMTLLDHYLMNRVAVW